jgi:menaquinone-dependent protoporphyrinogen oxidase
MIVLVAYASRHGATQGIAERVGQRLEAAGLDVEVCAAADASELAAHDAFVVGSAVHMFHWLKDGVRCVRRNHKALAARPTWLFSSGPLGTDTVDKEGRDVREVAQARETGELRDAVAARDHAMFFGAWQNGKPVGLGQHFVTMMPAARDALPMGDFRDWDAIDAWADGIAAELAASGALSVPRAAPRSSRCVRYTRSVSPAREAPHVQRHHR